LNPKSVIDFRTRRGGVHESKDAPSGDADFEVVKLDVKDGPRKHQLIRTAQLQRLGADAATFGDKREPITVSPGRTAFSTPCKSTAPFPPAATPSTSQTAPSSSR